MGRRDWSEWHRPYDDPESPLSERLALVQEQIHAALDRCGAGPISMMSMCAGQGRDVIGALVHHPRRTDVRATLVELDERNVAAASAAVARAGLDGVELVRTDAGVTDAYRTSVPAHIVLACGVFGNITDTDIARTIGDLPSLCAAGATVIWTRHRQVPDLTPKIRTWFAEAGFAEVSFEGPERLFIGVGSHRLAHEPRPFRPGRRLFDFVGYDFLVSPGSPARRPPDGGPEEI